MTALVFAAPPAARGLNFGLALCPHCHKWVPIEVTYTCAGCRLAFCDIHTETCGPCDRLCVPCHGERCDVYEPDDGHDVFNDELHHYDLDYR